MRDREHAESNNSAAISLLNTRQTDRAIALLRKATAEDPNDSQPFSTLGLALAIDGKYAEALDSLQKSYSLKPMNETLLSTGIVYYLQHDYDAAINSFNKILQANPKLCNVHGNIGMAFLRKGDLQQAAEEFGHMVHCSPGCDLGYYGEAMTNYLSGNLRAAREQAELALAINHYPPTLLLLAVLDALQGDVSRCRLQARQYNSLVRKHFQQRTMTELGYPSQHDFHYDPYLADNFDNGYLLLARSGGDPPYHQAYLASEGKVQSAIAHVTAELTQSPGDLFLTRQMGLLQWANANYTSAADAWESAVKQCPSCSVDLLYLSRTLALDGKTAQASQRVREFQKKEPSQEISPDFTETARIDPALQYETETHKHVQTIQREGPNPIPSNQF